MDEEHAKHLRFSYYSEPHSRYLWLHKLKQDPNGISGAYLFGGMTETGKICNDVWLIKPAFMKNREHMDP